MEAHEQPRADPLEARVERLEETVGIIRWCIRSINRRLPDPNWVASCDSSPPEIAQEYPQQEPKEA